MFKSDRTYWQGIGLATVLGSYMLSWTAGSKVGLPSFLGIGLFIAVGLFIIVYTSKSMIFEAVSQSISRYWWVYALLSIFTIASLFSPQPKDVVWACFGVLFVVSMSFINLGERSQLSLGFAHLSSVTSLFYLLLNQDAVMSASAYGDASRTSFSEDNAAFTLIAYAAAFGMTASFYNFYVSLGSRVIAVLSVLVCALAIVMAGTRSVYGGVALSIAYIVFVVRPPAGGRSSKFVILILVCIGVLGLSATGFMSDRLSHIQESIIRGSYTFLQLNAGDADDSGLGRVMQRQHALTLFSDNPVIGAGYKSYWVDFPLLQIFSDMGVFVGILFVWTVMIYPIYKLLVVGRVNDPSCNLMFVIYLANVPRLFLHGQPYDWVLYCYAFLPYFLLNPDWQKSTKRSNVAFPR